MTTSKKSTAFYFSRLSLVFCTVSLLFLSIADIQLYTPYPWQELALIGQGVITPSWYDLPELFKSLLRTIAFALLAVSASAVVGLLLATVFHWRCVRVLAAAVRSVHEIFWCLIFMQLWGLSATTGLLAIFVPFCGIFAKVFAEILQQQSPQTVNTFGPALRLSRFAYGWIPQAWPALLSYVRYRFECALRSSAILGFIGLPTLGFYLETAFKQGNYSEAAAILWLFILVIATVRWWFQPKYLLVYLLLSIWVLPDSLPIHGSIVWQFFTQDIWPEALIQGDLPQTLEWIKNVFSNEVWPALWQTIAITQLALILSGAIALISYPFASRVLVGRWSTLGRAKLLVLRSIPELMFAYVFLLIFGPSALPAILALAIHNGGLIAFLLANNSELEEKNTTLSNSSSIHSSSSNASSIAFPKGTMRYFYVDLPRRYPAFLALLFYRWEVIMRESA
ncbi:MAG: hypothetical protein P1U57_13855, partial [Oleibacter sp.]|nr:hypothetical protein [Thalassolituus sp.]